MERALLVTIKFDLDKEDWQLDDIAGELEELVSACGVEIANNVSFLREKPTPAILIGKGKAEEIASLCREESIDTVIFSHDLSGTQQRNLEEITGKKVIDRTMVILDIFARRAQTPEGKMQVELAQLQYLMPRLVGKGIMLSRLGGGIGTRGPGEQKLEVDRRRIRKRIDNLKHELRNVRLHRQTLRKRRKENAVPAVALVGYTNAGKSTLLNSLTQAGQAAQDSLFTTLDPLSKSFILPNGDHIVISDTVGFLHNLPHHLVEAFKATLEEVTEADLLIHVLDVSHRNVYEYNRAVYSVLEELGALDKPMITALNKIDLLEDKMWLESLKRDFTNPVLISARFGQNLGLLSEAIENNFCARMVDLELVLPSTRMDLVDLFYREGKVKEIRYLQKGIKVKVTLPKVLSSRILQNKSIEKLN